jgi:pyrroloquinoline-quinone synthase
MNLLQTLEAAVAAHDLLTHPFYQAWSMGQLTHEDLRHYAAQYQHQVNALPALLAQAHGQCSDPAARDLLERNLAEEQSHPALWARFAAALGAGPVAPDAETTESGAALGEAIGAGEIDALAALWSYERQTARVAQTKRVGLETKYDVREVTFFALHEQLDVHHAAELLAALERRCGSEEETQRAGRAAARSAAAQWHFLDGAEKRRMARS